MYNFYTIEKFSGYIAHCIYYMFGMSAPFFSETNFRQRKKLYVYVYIPFISITCHDIESKTKSSKNFVLENMESVLLHLFLCWTSTMCRLQSNNTIDGVFVQLCEGSLTTY